MPRKSSTNSRKRLEQALELIAAAARHCQEVEEQFGKNPAPALETVIKLHRVLLFQYTLESLKNPQVLKEVREVTKPIMDWAALQEKEKQRELAERKYHDQVEAKKAGEAAADGGAALRPETVDQIERELSLL